MSTFSSMLSFGAVSTWPCSFADGSESSGCSWVRCRQSTVLGRRQTGVTSVIVGSTGVGRGDGHGFSAVLHDNWRVLIPTGSLTSPLQVSFSDSNVELSCSSPEVLHSGVWHLDANFSSRHTFSCIRRSSCFACRGIFTNHRYSY